MAVWNLSARLKENVYVAVLFQKHYTVTILKWDFTSEIVPGMSQLFFVQDVSQNTCEQLIVQRSIYLFRKSKRFCFLRASYRQLSKGNDLEWFRRTDLETLLNSHKDRKESKSFARRYSTQKSKISQNLQKMVIDSFYYTVKACNFLKQSSITSISQCLFRAATF